MFAIQIRIEYSGIVGRVQWSKNWLKKGGEYSQFAGPGNKETSIKIHRAIDLLKEIYPGASKLSHTFVWVFKIGGG